MIVTLITMGELDRFITEKPSGCLYHYTGATGVIGILGNRKLWGTDYRHLNDHQEYRYGARLLKEELTSSKLTRDQRKNFERMVRETQKGCFVVSFSENGDQLSQWRAYCPGGSGYALGFSQNNDLFTAMAKEHSFNLVRCVYNLDKQRGLCKYLIDNYTNEMVANQRWSITEEWHERAKGFLERYQWSLAMSLVMSALKQTGFEEEREWRLVSQYPDKALYGVSFRPGRFGVTPYFKLPIASKYRRLEFEQI